MCSNDGSQEHTDNGEDGDFFYVKNQGQLRRLPPKVRFDDGETTSVGWVDPRSSKLISHICYTVEHFAQKFTLKLYQLDKAVKNYDNLAADDGARVPINA